MTENNGAAPSTLTRAEILRLAAAELLRMAAESEVGSPRQMVTLQQMAGWVHRSKRSLEYYRWRSKNRMPPPVVQGEGGKANLWDWKQVRAWLEATFRLNLPEKLPDVYRGR